MRIAGRLIIISERQMLMLYALAAIGLLIVVYFALTNSVVRRGSVTEKTIAAEEDRLTRNAKLYVKREQLFRSHDRAKPYFVAAEPDTRKIVAGFLRSIEEMARVRHLSIMSVSPADGAERRGSADAFRVAFKAEGSAEDIAGFFRDIDASPELCAFDLFSVMPVEGSGTKCRLDAALTLHRVVVTSDV
jgi:hypothetical protein